MSAFVALPAILAGHARNRPRDRALVSGGESRDWATLCANIDRIAAGFARLGVGRGAKVALLAANSMAYLETLFGALRAGACVVPLATSATAETIANMLTDAESTAIFADRGGRDRLGDRWSALAPRFAGRAIGFDFGGDGWIDWSAWFARIDPAGGQPPAIAPDDHFNIIYSSGTTSAPKGILHTHGMRAGQAGRRAFGFDESSIQLFATPLYSNTTLQPLFGCLAFGACAIVMPRFDATEYLRIAARERVTHTMLVPVQYRRILDHPDFGSYDLSAFRLKQATGAPFDARTKADAAARWPGRTIDLYGMTEGGTTCILDVGAHPDKLHTVGQPAPGTIIHIIDDGGRVLPAGAAGEIVGHNPWMMAGYYNQPQKTQSFYWRDAAGRVFHRSGDVGRFDADGFLILLDRKKDVIISGGFNIYASDLEAVLAAHPAVADSAVVGVPSERWGETPYAIVVMRPGASIASDALLAWVNERVGKTQRIAGLELRESLPRSPVGKLLRRELRDEVKGRT